MDRIRISDMTLCAENSTFSFKERLDIARHLEKLNVDVVELPQINNEKVDVLLVKTIASFVKQSTICVSAGMTEESVRLAAAALATAEHARIKIELPVSTVCMEYICHMKAPKMLSWIEKTVSEARKYVSDVEFAAMDATRAEPDFLRDAIDIAVRAGATSVSVYDSAAEMMPDVFAEFIGEIVARTPVPVGVLCDDKNGLACAEALMSVKKGATTIKTSVGGNALSLETFAGMIRNCGNSFGVQTDVRYTELNRTVRQIAWISDGKKGESSVLPLSNSGEGSIILDKNDSREAVAEAVKKLGYDLSDEDSEKVYTEFLRAAEKKNVDARELEAIVASTALQVPETYKLISFVVNSGNTIAATAQITLEIGRAHV